MEYGDGKCAADWSVTEWIAEVKAGDGEAANHLWERYFARVQAAAKRMLRGCSRRALDEEDVAASVFESFFDGAAAQRFDALTDRDDLWCLLIVITKQKSVDQRRFLGAEKRGGNHVAAASELSAHSSRQFFDDLFSSSPSPAEVAQFDDQFQRLMGQLRDDTLRSVAHWRMARYSVKEIAAKMAVTTSAVERKLRLIRTAWAKELRRDG